MKPQLLWYDQTGSTGHYYIAALVFYPPCGQVCERHGNSARFCFSVERGDYSKGHCLSPHGCIDCAALVAERDLNALSILKQLLIENPELALE